MWSDVGDTLTGLVVGAAAVAASTGAKLGTIEVAFARPPVLPPHPSEHQLATWCLKRRD